MSDSLPVALDALGGDQAPRSLVAGALLASEWGLPVVLVGEPEQLEPLIPRGRSLEIVPARALDVETDPPVRAVRRQEQCSVRQAIRLVAEGRASAAVSCGHTGSVMASALFELGRGPGVERPAVTRGVPRTDGGQLVILDLGANVDCRPSQLLQFALMGAAYARRVGGVAEPRVGLLSNGTEEGKGNELVRGTLELLEAELPGRADIHLVGQVEPHAAFRGACDVLVCDGFVGNVLLKTVEGTAEVVGHLLREEILAKPSARFGAWLLQGAFRRFRARTDWSSFGGALLLGVPGVVLVGHGRSDARAVAETVRHAARCAEEGIPDAIMASLGRSAL